MILTVLGLAVVVLATVDVVWSTLSVGSGMGPVSRLWVGAVWRAVLRRHHAGGRDHDRLARRGFFLLLSVAVLWVVMLLVGWSLVLSAGDQTATDSDGVSAGIGDRVYLAGYSVLTLGNGDVEPRTGPAQVAVVGASVTGLLLLTLTVTYLVPLVSAAATKRELGVVLAGLGRPPAGVLARSFDGSGFSPLSSHLTSLGPSVAGLAQSHVIYPVLDLLPARETDLSPAVGIAVLDEALTLHDVVVAPEARLPEMTIAPLRHAITHYLETLRSGMVQSSDGEPPVPDISPLQDAGVPLVGLEERDEGFAALGDRRSLLKSLVEDDGWTWGHVSERAEVPTDA